MIRCCGYRQSRYVGDMRRSQIERELGDRGQGMERTRINCACGRHLADALHRFFADGALVVLPHPPRTHRRDGETHTFTCHPKNCCRVHEPTEDELLHLLETAIPSAAPVILR